MKIIMVTLLMVLGVLTVARLDRPADYRAHYQPCATDGIATLWAECGGGVLPTWPMHVRVDAIDTARILERFER